MLNFPHNPTGAVLDDSDLDALEAIVRDTGVLLLSDEVYEHIVFDGKPHASVARRPLLAEHAFVISSFGKPITPPAGRSATAARRASSAPNCARCTSSWCSPCLRPCSTRWPNSCAIPSPTWPCRPSTRPSATACRGLENAFPPLPSPGTFFLLADYSDISKQAEADFARPDREPRRHRDSRVGLLPPTRRAGIQSPHRALLLRQEGRDAGCRAGAACFGVVQAPPQPERARQMARSFIFTNTSKYSLLMFRKQSQREFAHKGRRKALSRTSRAPRRAAGARPAGRPVMPARRQPSARARRMSCGTTTTAPATHKLMATGL